LTGTGRAAQSPHSDGDGLPPGELVQRHRGASPGRMMAQSRRCQGVKCPRTGSRRACSEYPRARRTPFEGGADPRARRSLLEASVPLERDEARPREARILDRGGARSRGSSSGPSWWAVGASAARAASCMISVWLWLCCGF
jgi:hypothetical protein